MSKKDNLKVGSSDPVAKGSEEVDQQAQEEAKASQTPQEASQAIAKNTYGYVDGDGSGSKGFVTDPAQRALLDVGDPNAEKPKELKPGEESEPESAADQIRKTGEAAQRALKKQQEDQKKAEEEAREEGSEQQKAEDERPNKATQLDREEKRVRAGGPTDEELAKDSEEKKEEPAEAHGQVTHPATSQALGGVDTTGDMKTPGSVNKK